MKKLAKIFWATVLVIVLAGLLDFVAINWVLGCETWDRELWTESNSCFVPSDLWRNGG